MKKVIAMLAALVCAAATAVNAGAFDLTNCDAEWDPVTDNIYYRDRLTEKIVAVEYPDGRIEEYTTDETEEAEDAPVTEEEQPSTEVTDPWVWYETEETPDDAEIITVETEEPWVYLSDPRIASVTVKSTSVTFTAVIDKQWDFDGWELYHESWWEEDTLVAEGTNKYDYSADEYGIDITDKGLEPGEEYSYCLLFYKNTEWGRSEQCSVRFSETTELPMFKTKMSDSIARTDSVELIALIDSRKEADGYVAEQYIKGKWVTVVKEGTLYSHYIYEDENISRNYELRETNCVVSDLKPMTKYKFRIRFYKLNDKKKREYLDTVTTTVTTLMEAPKLDLGATSKKAKLSWNKVKGADGYEVYVRVQDASSGDYSDNWGWYSESYLSYGGGWFNEDSYKKLKTIKGGNSTAASYNIKGNKVYTYCVRAYKGSGKKRTYSEFSETAASNSTTAILNGLTLKSKPTGLGDYDLGLIKSAVKQCVTNDMTNAEKAVAVYNYVHNVAYYEYDINKVSLDSIKAILVDHAGQCYQYAVTYQAMMKYLGFDMKLIGGKTASGGPHWWNEMMINGTPRMFDPQVGGRFCILYEQLGSRMVTKEKTVD